MKAFSKKAGMVISALALVVLTACGGASESINFDYVVVDTVNNATCDVKSELVTVIDFVNNVEAGSKQEEDILKRNPEGTTLQTVKDSLNSKINECGGSASPDGSTSCPSGFDVRLDANINGNVDSDGIQNSSEDIEGLRHDPRDLTFRANLMGLWEDRNNWKPFVTPDEKCYSDKGIEVFNLVKGALTGAGVQVEENAQAPADWYNTGMANGVAAVNPTPGISGNRAAIKYTLRDGTVIYVLKRCKNVPLPSKPSGMPEKPLPDSECEEICNPQNPPCEGTGCSPKRSSEAPGQGGVGDGGDSKYGGPGEDRQVVTGPGTPPAAGDPPTQPQPAPQQPAPNPVPGGTPNPAPVEPPPPATGAPPPSAAPTTAPCAPGRC